MIQVPAANTNLTTYTGRTTFVDRVSAAIHQIPELSLFRSEQDLRLESSREGEAADWSVRQRWCDYRYQRRAVENIGLARNFRFKERFNLRIRAEFTNIFNRTEPNNLIVNNAVATPTSSSNGNTSGGFGAIITNPTTGAVTFSPPGTLVARFQFESITTRIGRGLADSLASAGKRMWKPSLTFSSSLVVDRP